MAIQQFYTPKNFYTPQKKQISGYAPEDRPTFTPVTFAFNLIRRRTDSEVISKWRAFAEWGEQTGLY